jgi:mxaJ protein
MRAQVLIAFILLCIAGVAPARELRVCADPNNLPFSDEQRAGFDNRIAALLAQDLHAELVYTWWAQRRGAVRNTIGAGKCDVMFGVPSGTHQLATTQPYYRSRYVFVTRKADDLQLHSLDDPRLRQLIVGVQLAGGSSATPPGQLLAQRGITSNVRGFLIAANYAQPAPQRAILHALATHDIDAALVWGPLAGYFATREAEPLTLSPIADESTVLPLEFSFAIGVRPDNAALRDELDAALVRQREPIAQILHEYGVPLVPTDVDR